MMQVLFKFNMEKGKIRRWAKAFSADFLWLNMKKLLVVDFVF